MHIEQILVAISLSVLAFGLISNKSDSHSVTAPMVFVIFGFLGHLLGLSKIDLSHGFIHIFLEITLILVLFTDASKINFRLLNKQRALPVRMLLVGMPLTILFGGIGAQLIFSFDSIWYAFLLAAILAPTDAALGQVVVTSKNVPIRIRQSLNVESGLNDGIALPVILIFLAIAKTISGHGSQEEMGVFHWIFFTAKQIILGPIAGVFVGICGGKVISWAAKNEWMNRIFQDLSLTVLSFLAFGLAEMVGGNGFIAAFCAGLAIGNTAVNLCKCLYEFAETEGQLLTLCVFLLVGLGVMPEFKTGFWIVPVFSYAILSLTVFRMLPVSISLIGSKLKMQSHLFLGWFGPRGLASILFALLMLEDLHSPTTELIFSIVLATTFLSIFLHGASASPLAKIYARSVSVKNKHAEEHVAINPMPTKNMSIDH